MNREGIAFKIFDLLTETDMKTLGDQKRFCYAVADFILEEYGPTPHVADGLTCPECGATGAILSCHVCHTDLTIFARR